MRNSILLLMVTLLPVHLVNSAENVDLSAITHFAPKGRVQDQSYNPNQPVIDSLVARGIDSIPILIELLDNDTLIDHKVLDYWPSNTIGDIAFVILTDFATDSNWETSTIPGASWDVFLGNRDPNVPGWNQLDAFKKKHGSKGIKRRWKKIWSEHRAAICWDPKERCFRLKTSREASNQPMDSGAPSVPAMGVAPPVAAVEQREGTSRHVISSSPSQWYNHYVFMGAVNWDLGVSDEGVVEYVSTKDPRFKTPEGFSVGMQYSDVRTRSNDAIEFGGWAWAIELPSGWSAAFVCGPTRTEPLLGSTPISFLFRKYRPSFPVPVVDEVVRRKRFALEFR